MELSDWDIWSSSWALSWCLFVQWHLRAYSSLVPALPDAVFFFCISDVLWVLIRWAPDQLWVNCNKKCEWWACPHTGYRTLYLPLDWFLFCAAAAEAAKSHCNDHSVWMYVSSLTPTRHVNQSTWNLPYKLPISIYIAFRNCFNDTQILTNYIYCV